MLSAFEAEAVHELKAKDKSRIESLLAYGDRLLVGLNTGSLRIYRVNEKQVQHSRPASQDLGSQSDNEAAAPPPSSPPATKSKPIELLREEDRFSKKPVQQLAIVKEANLLVSLSDGFVSLHDLQTYTLIERLEKTRGALCFAVTSNVIKDPETSIPSLVSRLVVGVKRRLLCWTWNDMELASTTGEIALEGTIKTLTWSTDTKVAVGMDAGFSVVDLQTEDVLPVIKPATRQPATAKDDHITGELAGVRFAAVSSSGMGYMGMGSWVPKPMCTRVCGDELLFAKDVNTLFTDLSGKPLEKRQVPWSLSPEAIGYSYPYLLALQPPDKGVLQIRNPDTLNLLQSIPVPQATILHVPQPRISLAHAGKGFLVASDRVIWRMNALSYPSQVEDLVSKGRFDEAVSFLNLLEDTLIDDKLGRIREVRVRKAEHLFHERKYRQALDLFTDAKASVDRVVRLYPRSIAGDLTIVLSDDESSDEDPFVDKPTDKSAPSAARDVPVTPSKSVLGRFKATQTPQKQQSSTDSDNVSITSPRVDADNMSIRSTRSPAKPQQSLEKALTGDDLKVAVRALCSYLAQSRVQVQKYLNSDGTLKEAPPSVDMETHKPVFSDLLPDSLFAGKGPWPIDYDAELVKVARLVDTTLFKAYMLALPSLAGPLFRLDNFCDPEVVQRALYETERYGDLIDFLHGKKLHRQSLDMLQKFGKGEVENVDEVLQDFHGPTKSIAYLRQLPPELIDMILDFARWPLTADPEAALGIFTADSDNAERLDRQRIDAYLRDIDTMLEREYLEHVIDEWHDTDPEFHQRLIDLFVSELKADPSMPEPHHDELQHRLEAFLRQSRYYNRGQTFRLLDAANPTFFVSRAIVLTEMGNYKQALSIYVYQLYDYEEAEAHCTRIYLRLEAEKVEKEKVALDGQTRWHGSAAPPLPRRDTQPDNFTEDKGNVFAMLLGLYLRPPADEEKRWPQALELLSKHGARLPASSTLDLMPDDLAIQELQNYFLGRMRHSGSLLREERLVKALESVRRTRAEGELLLGKESVSTDRPQGRNRRVVVGEFDHCKVCHKRFGASAVRAWPDGTVTHYGCTPGQPERARGW